MNDDNELLCAGDPQAQAHFQNLERQGKLWRTGEVYHSDCDGRSYPIYTTTPPKPPRRILKLIQARLDALERQGVIERTGESKRGCDGRLQPVYRTRTPRQGN